MVSNFGKNFAPSLTSPMKINFHSLLIQIFKLLQRMINLKQNEHQVKWERFTNYDAFPSFLLICHMNDSSLLGISINYVRLFSMIFYPSPPQCHVIFNNFCMICHKSETPSPPLLKVKRHLWTTSNNWIF